MLMEDEVGDVHLGDDLEHYDKQAAVVEDELRRSGRDKVEECNRKLSEILAAKDRKLDELKRRDRDRGDKVWLMREQIDEMNSEREGLKARELEILKRLNHNARLTDDLTRSSLVSSGAKIGSSVKKGANIQAFLKRLIKEKEAALRCPVCSKEAGPPIFMCPDSHLICGSCKEKV